MVDLLVTINIVLPDEILKELKEVVGSGGKSLDEMISEAAF